MPAKSGGKNRKYGRHLKSPAAKAYTAEKRSVKNAAKRATKVARMVAKKAANPPKVPRGTARSLRRKHLGVEYENRANANTSG